MTITLEQIKELRLLTGISTTACKKALEEAKGDMKIAIKILQKKGETKALDRAQRETKQGVISSYIHTNKKIGTLVDLGCETDFVAKNEEFQNLAYNIAMHIAAMDPKYIKPEDAKEDDIKKEKYVWKEELKNEGKPENIWEKILEGKEKKYREESSLLTQPYVKNQEITIEKLIQEYVVKLGENIRVNKFVRFAL
ncbi:elongation factor Ts [Candidatus Peregrinibacteria bacterium]|nr:elongation factor Ts [Candidatus Peregrinibacteria bacterium]